MKIDNVTRSLHLAPALALAAVILLAPGCYEDVPNLNGLDLDELEENPTPQLVNEAAVGLLIGNRAGKSPGNGYVSILGILGRESYNFDPADPRFRSELLESPLDSGSPAFGGNFWVLPYRNIKNAYTLLRALDVVAGMSDADKNAVRGFTKTIMAHEFLTLVNTRNENPIPIAVDREINDELAPCVSRDEVLDEIERLLDEGCRDLGQCADLGACESPDANPGPNESSPEFPFALGSGFAGMDSTAGFTTFNRALRARVAVYRQEWDCALDMVDQSFVSSDPATLDVGAYWVYSTGSGDATNGLTNVNLYVHPSVLTDAETGDARLTGKVTELDEPASINSGDRTYNATHAFSMYSSPTAPLPIIRNEELLLIRAEGNIGLGMPEAALPDINLVREAAGQLAPLTSLDAADAVDQLLYERRYSLLFEGGHRWIDTRRYGMLETLLEDDEIEDLVVQTSFPIPVNEANARPPGSCE